MRPRRDNNGLRALHVCLERPMCLSLATYREVVTMRWMITVGILAIGMMLTTTGCGRALGEAYEVVTGPKGVVKEVTSLGPKNARPLGLYENFEVGTFVDDFGGQVPPELLRDIGAATIQALAKRRLPAGKATGKTGVINGRVFYYEDASVAGHIFGPFEEALAAVQLVDKETGQVVAESICIGRTTKSARKGVNNKTQGMADAISKWIDRRYPKEAGRIPKE